MDDCSILELPPVAASKDDGESYLTLLVILKNLLPGKSISIAAPSYWYLKQYPHQTLPRSSTTSTLIREGVRVDVMKI
ncbi:uncharacterized protein PG986_010056 [Apiospora aurea]|uniref:Uncharacterized protein n=1 Tax=Apiospora aurea TaxID=335848 RepID=A0ABR1Q9I1_9PEZI